MPQLSCVANFKCLIFSVFGFKGLRYANTSLHIHQYCRYMKLEPCLPQHDRQGQRRQDYIARNQSLYRYDYQYLAPYALIDGGDQQAKIPPAEQFSLEYKVRRQLTRWYATANAKLSELRSQFDPLDELEDFDDFYTVFPEPKRVIQIYQTDRSFAEQRLSGANPMVMRWLKPTDDRAQLLHQLAQSNTKIAALLNVAAELDKGNLYIADYTGLADGYTGPRQVKGGRFDDRQKYLPKCRGFFWWNGQELMPLAIQLADGDHRLYTKYDPDLDWLYAKICLQVADGNHHELVAHLGQVHMVMEPFAMATNRQLAQNHPLSLLLRPHFRFMLRNNNTAHDKLINPNGPVDHVMAGTLDETLNIVKQAMGSWRLDEAALPVALANRGVDDRDRLPHFPYRDDALLLWDAIYQYVTDYVNYFYPDSESVPQDYELQQWAQEITSDEGGRTQGMPSKIETADQLINIISNLLFIVGPQHAAVNFSQYDYMTFVANMPLAAYSSPTVRPESMTPQDIMTFLPTAKATASQLRILYLLAAYRYDRLGDYHKSFKDLYKSTVADVFAQTPIPSIVEKFQQQLNVIEAEIDRRNRQRLVAYPYLKPSLIPNSTSV
jgi:arachidonate 15-lipoxygenase